MGIKQCSLTKQLAAHNSVKHVTNAMQVWWRF